MVFSKRKCCKSLEAYYCKIGVYCDLFSARFGVGFELLENFFFVWGVVDKQMVLLSGDLRKKAFKKSNAVPLTLNVVFVAKKEQVFCKKFFNITMIRNIK